MNHSLKQSHYKTLNYSETKQVTIFVIDSFTQPDSFKNRLIHE